MDTKLYLNALLQLAPEAKVTIHGDGTIVYEESYTGPKPTIEEIEAVISDVQVQLQKTSDLDILNKAVNKYICDVYDYGTQMSLKVLHDLPTTPSETVSFIEQAWAWITEVLAHYYECKVLIEEGTSLAECGWNPSQYDDDIPQELSLKNAILPQA